MHKCAFLLGHPNGVATTRFINTDRRGINHSGKEHEAKKMAMDKMAHTNLFCAQLFLFTVNLRVMPFTVYQCECKKKNFPTTTKKDTNANYKRKTISARCICPASKLFKIWWGLQANKFFAGYTEMSSW